MVYRLAAGGSRIRTFSTAARKPAISEGSQHDCGADSLNRSHRSDQRKQAGSGRYEGENSLVRGRDERAATRGRSRRSNSTCAIKDASDTEESPAPSSGR